MDLLTTLVDRFPILAWIRGSLIPGSADTDLFKVIGCLPGGAPALLEEAMIPAGEADLLSGEDSSSTTGALIGKRWSWPFSSLPDWRPGEALDT